MSKASKHLRQWNWDWQRKKDLLAALEQQGGHRGFLHHLLFASLNSAWRKDGEDNSDDGEDSENSEVLHFDLRL